MSGRPARGDHWHVEVTPDCVGSGMCIATAPGHFHLVDGYSEPRNAVVAPHDALVAAAELCPMSAILVREATQDDLTPLGPTLSPGGDG